ncbi:hypothetical protein FQR65_LT08020 [Abscondita terminalis]|nr:hypothetical protein FQR65_LT08020 [Abscondita terminalis]
MERQWRRKGVGKDRQRERKCWSRECVEEKTEVAMMDLNDQPNSICHVRAIQMYQLPNINSKIHLPFALLNGEDVSHCGNSVDGLLVLTNYRLFLNLCDSQHHVPLGLIELVEHRDLFYLHIGCKDARTYRCTFDNNEVCIDWFGRLLKTYSPPKQLEELFAFFYYAWSKEKKDETFFKLESNKNLVYDENAFKNEVERLKFDLHGAWRISSVNRNYKLCPSYPPQLLVPACITDETLEIVAKFRSSRRIPTVVWRHPGNGAVIARCSQPEVGWLGWRSGEDEDLLKAISDACTYDQGPKTMWDNASHSPTSTNSEESSQTQTTEIAVKEKKKVLIMDARSYTTAVANRARGGGCECPEYYPNCEMQFMNLANIHSIRKSFHALRQLCTTSADQSNWFSLLDGTRWLQHMSGLMKAAVTLVNAVDRECRPVLVHCSDGWDRTPQIVALAELLLDPFYRTLTGFRILIEREWLAFGHKFADRCGQATGSDDQNERCPVFLQWLDCVHQLLFQFPCAFEFSHTYLVKLAQHTYSNLFGTFLCNTKQERVERVNDSTFSVWSFLNSPCFRNHLYAAPAIITTKSTVLWPQCNVRDLQLWAEVYLGSLEIQNMVDTGSSTCPGPPSYQMTKTRSYGDLVCATETCRTSNRRKSDPSITEINRITSNDLIATNRGTDFVVSNGHSTPGEYLPNDLEGTDNCNNDCIYKNSNQTLSDDSVDLLDSSKMEVNCEVVNNCSSASNVIAQISDKRHDESDHKSTKNRDHYLGDCESAYKVNSNVISNQKTDKVNENLDTMTKHLCDINGFESICLRPLCDIPKIHLKGDINHNGDLKSEEVDSDTECTEPSDSKSETTVIHDPLTYRGSTHSVETSTDTLTSESVPNLSPKQINGFERLSSPDVFNGNIDFCKVCAQNIKFIHGKHSHNSNSTSGKNSRYSTPPLYSRTPSGNNWETTLNSIAHPKTATTTHRSTLGDDGLVPLRSDMQDRLWQIIEEQKRKEEALQRELHTYRQALIKQVCHQCNYEAERIDDTVVSSDRFCFSCLFTSLQCSENSSPFHNLLNTFPLISSSVVESICSAGEGQASAVESLKSDISWEAVEEGSAFPEGISTLWVPDHAVSRCTGCQTQFWLGRRKHHCSKLRRDCGEIPDQCKHAGSQTPAANQQIAASSN